jgi:multicomponent Na+:H+ antiporter subunit D
MNWTIAPILLPLVTAIVALIWERPSICRRIFAALSALAQLILSLWLVEQTWLGRTFVLPVGDWSPRVGIVLVVDLLSAVMLSLCSLTALASILYGFAESSVTVEHPLRFVLVQFLVLGIDLSFCTGDLFNLFVAFEVMLISSYALLALEADDWDIRQVYPYVAINLVGSTLFICGAGLAYGLFGTLNFAEISVRAREHVDDPWLQALALLFLVVFGIKAGLFPLCYWLPNSYPTLAFPLAGLFSGMLTKVGVYVLIRVFGTVLPHDLGFVHQLLATLAGLTMVLAVMSAISRNFMRGILSFHILSQIGFMLLAVGLFTPLSFAAAIFYITHHIIVKASLFLICGVAFVLQRTDDLDKMGNLWKHTPWLGVLFLLQALSLAGIPPLSGFWGKYVILVVGIERGEWVLVAAAVLASILTLFSMLKIWNGAFWKVSDSASIRIDDRRWVRMTWVVAGMTAISVAIGLGAEPVFLLATRAAELVLDQDGYAELVFRHLGKGAER